LRLVYTNTKSTRSFSHCCKKGISSIIIFLSINQSPLTFLEMEWLSMKNPSLFIVTPFFDWVIFWVKDLCMIKLFSLNLSESLLDWKIPFIENSSLMEILNQSTYSVVPVIGLSDHMFSQATHIVCILGEIFGQTCFMASWWQQIYVLVSLSQSEKRLSKFFVREFYFVFFLHILNESYLILCSNTSERISLFPNELLRLRILVPQNIFNLIWSRIVWSNNY
jgi:hypothetical protein